MNTELIDSLVATRDRIIAEQKAAEEECKAKERELNEFRDAVFFKVVMPPVHIMFEDGLTVAIDSRAKMEALLAWCDARMFEFTGKDMAGNHMTEQQRDAIFRTVWAALRNDPFPEPEMELPPVPEPPTLLAAPQSEAEPSHILPSDPEPSDLLTVQEAATRVDRVAQSVYNGIQNGSIPRHRVNGQIMVSLAELREWDRKTSRRERQP